MCDIYTTAVKLSNIKLAADLQRSQRSESEKETHLSVCAKVEILQQEFNINNTVEMERV